MPARRLAPLLALALTAVAPASALAAPTVTATGDEDKPVPLNTLTTVALRNMDVAVRVSIPQGDGPAYRAQVVDQDGAPASDASACEPTRSTPTWTNYATYRGNGTYSVIVREYPNDNCAGTPAQHVFHYAIDAGLTITPPATRVLTRAPNSFLTRTHEIAISLNAGAAGYEVRYARGGVAGPDGAIAGPSTEAFLDTATGLAGLRFDDPGGYLIVARARRGDFSTPWSPPVEVRAVAPFDLERVTFPDARGPRFTLRGQVRERVARGQVAISWAKGRKGGRFHGIGKARLDRKGRFTTRFSLRAVGLYRLRLAYPGSTLVAPGRVTEHIRIRRRLGFG